MNPIEISFFAVAVLLPLVGGGTLLYFLSRDAKKTSENADQKQDGESARSAHPSPPEESQKK